MITLTAALDRTSGRIKHFDPEWMPYAIWTVIRRGRASHPAGVDEETSRDGVLTVSEAHGAGACSCRHLGTHRGQRVHTEVPAEVLCEQTGCNE
jgi:hypothetical protein